MSMWMLIAVLMLPVLSMLIVGCVKRCCPACEIGADDFEYTGDPDAEKWTIESGTWSVASGIASISGAGTLVCAQTPIDDGASVRASVMVRTTGDGSVQLKIAKYDVDDYLFVQLDRSNDILSMWLGQVVAGTETELEPPVDLGAATDDFMLLRVCWDPGSTAGAGPGFDGAYLPRVVEQVGEGWGDIENILDYEAGWAIYAMPEGVSVTPAIVAHDFRLLPPAGSTIDGIKLWVLYGAEGVGGETGYEVHDKDVELFAGEVQVGDNKGTNTSIPDEDNLVIVYGGDADDWNAGLTWEQVRSPQFIVRIIMDTDTPGQTGPMIAHITIGCYFTAPERTFGKLTGLVTIGQTTCIKDFSVQVPSLGRQAAIASISGDWDFDDFAYSYLQGVAPFGSCPTCGCPAGGDGPACECCTSSGEDFRPFESYRIILLHTLGDDICDGCDEIPQDFVVDALTECLWEYQETTGVCEDFRNDAGNWVTFLQTFNAMLVIVSENGECRWRLDVRFPWGAVHTATGTVLQDPSNPDQNVTNGWGNGHTATYYSDPITDCRALPKTLTRSPTDFGGEEFNETCTGDFPDTVELEEA